PCRESGDPRTLAARSANDELTPLRRLVPLEGQEPDLGHIIRFRQQSSIVLPLLKRIAKVGPPINQACILPVKFNSGMRAEFYLEPYSGNNRMLGPGVKCGLVVFDDSAPMDIFGK